MFHQRIQHTICFSETLKRSKKKLQSVPVYKASAVISKKWEKLKAREKKTKWYRDIYEEEKRRHGEALQRYQEGHMDEVEIINLQKRSNKKAKNSLKKHQSHLNL